MKSVSKNLIFEKSFELANKECDTLTKSQILKRTIFYYFHFCVCLNIEVSINDKHLKSMHNGELKDDFGVILQE